MTPEAEVDTIRLRGRVKDADSIERCSNLHSARLFVEATGEVGHRLVAGSDVLRSGARVGVDVRHDGVPEAWFEFSAPKVGTGSNVVPLPLPAGLEVAREVYDEAGDLVDWVEPFENLRVLRVDVDNDFEEVSQQDALLGALARVKAPYSPKTRLYPDAEKSGATTLTRGPAARWLATLYSKEGEARHRLRYAKPEHKEAARVEVERAKGRLRYEARLRPEVMGRNLRLVRDLDGESLARLARGYFDRVGYGLEVSGMQRAVAVVMGAEDLRLDARMSLIGWLFLNAHNMAPEVHRNSERKYRARSRALGVGAAELLELAADESVRLDYDTRRMVAA